MTQEINDKAREVQAPRIAMLSTGEEVLFGDIVDTNASWLSAFLFERGFQMTTRTTVGDSLQAISEGISSLATNHDIVIVNGGLGPTSDDLTAEAAALCAEIELELYDEWIERLELMYLQWQRPMPSSNIKQAMLPKGSEILDNPRGTACGFMVNIHGALCYFTPGVPHEFKTMVAEQILPDISQRFSSVSQKQVHRIYTFGLSESGIANRIEALKLPADVSLGYRSALPFIEVKIFYSDSSEQVSEFIASVEQELSLNTISINQDVRDFAASLMKEQGRGLNVFDCATQGYFHHWIAESSLKHDVTINSVNIPTVLNHFKGDDYLITLDGLYEQFSLERSGSNTLIITNTQSGGVQFILEVQDKILSQSVVFKRDYSFNARNIVISAIAIDMLRRHLNNDEMFADYGSVTRVSSNITTL
ncbi:CinA-like protein [Vibrio inusitatus NBRC 102082]|uniref:CinA-like protein n=1 Tax=Vibrio inusitatus NBRC 102082 TaxID=1219070 RepID=A0A4Y3HTN4_9VIBR|nr:molybdopterin-binding protein [Vibrio inusitatus]GEA50112.1 CinA-like protein [Vibrio inusitatus NBRC 102082]